MLPREGAPARQWRGQWACPLTLPSCVALEVSSRPGCSQVKWAWTGVTVFPPETPHPPATWGRRWGMQVKRLQEMPFHQASEVPTDPQRELLGREPVRGPSSWGRAGASTSPSPHSVGEDRGEDRCSSVMLRAPPDAQGAASQNSAPSHWCHVFSGRAGGPLGSSSSWPHPRHSPGPTNDVCFAG